MRTASPRWSVNSGPLASNTYAALLRGTVFENLGLLILNNQSTASVGTTITDVKYTITLLDQKSDGTFEVESATPRVVIWKVTSGDVITLESDTASISLGTHATGTFEQLKIDIAASYFLGPANIGMSVIEATLIERGPVTLQ